MASKAKHAKRSKYSSHNYKDFPMFLRHAAAKQNSRVTYTPMVKEGK